MEVGILGLTHFCHFRPMIPFYSIKQDHWPEMAEMGYKIGTLTLNGLRKVSKLDYFSLHVIRTQRST